MKKSAIAGSLLCFTLASLSASAAPSAGCTQADLVTTQSLYQNTETQYAAKQVSLLELRAAETVYLEIQLCAGSLSLKDYCSKKNAALTQMLNIHLKAGSLLGDGMSSPMGILRQIANLRTDCQ